MPRFRISPISALALWMTLNEGEKIKRSSPIYVQVGIEDNGNAIAVPVVGISERLYPKKGNRIELNVDTIDETLPMNAGQLKDIICGTRSSGLLSKMKIYAVMTQSSNDDPECPDDLIFVPVIGIETEANRVLLILRYEAAITGIR